MSNVFFGLAALACPIGMGAMMWFMGKGMRPKQARTSDREASVEDLRDEHRRLGQEIERLDAASGEDRRPQRVA